MTKSKYIVYVADNFHYMDESERYCAGSYDTVEGAIEKCKQIVESSLSESAENTSNAEDLYSSYTNFGEDPFIVGPGKGADFSAWDYAEKRSKEIFSNKNNERKQQ